MVSYFTLSRMVGTSYHARECHAKRRVESKLRRFTYANVTGKFLSASNIAVAIHIAHICAQTSDDTHDAAALPVFTATDG